MQRLYRRYISALSLILALMPITALASSYPEKTINIIVPYGPGGTTDVFARAFAQILPTFLPGNAKVIVINKPGGSSTIGVSALHRARPDGYTLGMLPTGVLEVQPHLKRVPWQIDDFEPIIGLLEIPAALNVLNTSPLQDFDAWLEHVQSKPASFMYSTSGGVGSSTHIAMEYAQRLLNAKLRWIPFEGEAASRGALLAGKIDGNFSIPTLHRGGELRPLVFITDSKPKSELYKDTPTLRDLGLDFAAQFPLGVVAPKNTPKELILLLHTAFKEAMNHPDIQRLYELNDLAPKYQGPDAFGATISRNSDLARETLNTLGLVK